MEKIRVHGKAMNRTALGIANAYLKINPNATLEELNRAFPISLNGKNRSETIFIDVKDAHKFSTQKEGNSTYEMFFFEKEDELLKLKNGQKVAMLELWTKDDFEKIVNHAKQYGIVVASFETTKVMQRGSFELEYLNGFTPTAIQATKEEKKFPWWILLLGLLLLGGLLYWLFGRNKEVQEIEVLKRDTIVQVQKDTVVVMSNELNTQANEIATVLPEAKVTTDGDNIKLILDENAIRFDIDKYDLTDTSKANLDKLYEVFNKTPENTILVTGFTDNTGDAAHNIKLSENRAKAVVDYLVSKGLPKTSLTFLGKGDALPIADNATDEGKAQNRRVEFILTDK